MTKKKLRLDFWFWVKVLVVGIMLLFLIYPFCTLITRSFFSSKDRPSVPGQLHPVFYEKILLLRSLSEPVCLQRFHGHFPAGGRTHRLPHDPVQTFG